MGWLIFGMLVFCCLSLVIMLFCLKDIDDRIDFTRQEYNSMYNYVRSTNDIVRSNLLPNFDKMLADYKKKIESEKSRLEKTLNGFYKKCGSNDVVLKRNCQRSPEQYIIYIKGIEVGYIKYRHGVLTINYKDVDIYEEEAPEDWEDDDELPDIARVFVLNFCKNIITFYHNKHNKKEVEL